MGRFLCAVVVLVLSIAPLHAQELDWSALSKEQTIAEVSGVIGDINRLYARNAQGGAGVTPELTQRIIGMIATLQSNLGGNPFVRLKSFTIGVPNGLNVEFEFQPHQD